MCKEKRPKVEYEITVNVLKIWFILNNKSNIVFFIFIFCFYRMQTSAGSLYICCEKGKIQNNTFLYIYIYSLYVCKQKRTKKQQQCCLQSNINIIIIMLQETKTTKNKKRVRFTL